MDEPIYFLHIPRTAGTTFISLIDSQFDPVDVCPAQLLPELFHIPADALSRYRLFRGHLWYGLNSYLDCDLRYLTLLRDPFQRTVSYFSAVRNNENAYRHGRVVDGNWSLLDFVREDETNWDTINTQTLFLAVDLDYAKLARDPIGYGQAVVKQYARRLNDRALLDTAKKRLEQFAFVGITERLQDSMHLLFSQMGWYPDISPTKLNVSTNRPREEEISHETRQAIKEITQLDQELYDWADQLFEERFGRMVNSPIVAKNKTNGQKVNAAWRTRPLPIDMRRHFAVRILDAPSEVRDSASFQVLTLIANNSDCVISSCPPNPIHISYHWIEEDQWTMTVFDGERTRLTHSLAANEKRRISVSVTAPGKVGRYVLRVTLVQEGIAWFDAEESRVFSDIEIVVEAC